MLAEQDRPLPYDLYAAAELEGLNPEEIYEMSCSEARGFQIVTEDNLNEINENLWEDT